MPVKKAGDSKPVSSYRLPERTRRLISRYASEYGSEAAVIVAAVALLERHQSNDELLKAMVIARKEEK